MRVVMATGAVRGKRLRKVAKAPLGIWIKTLWNHKGIISGSMAIKVNWLPSRALGASVPWEEQVAASRNLTLVPELVGQAA